MVESMDNAGVAARLLAQVARRVGSSLALDETLVAIANAVVEALGFRSSVVNLVAPDDELYVVAVAGTDELKEALAGRHSSRKSWDGLLSASVAWGDLRFLQHGSALPDGLDDLEFYVPPLPMPGAQEERSWHPHDALFAPLIGTDGELLGVLSVDDPEDGMLPTKARSAMLEAFAVHAALAIEHARAHEEVTDSEALLTQIFSESPVPKALLDEQWVFTRVNRAFCDFFGRSPDQMLGRHSREFADPNDPAGSDRIVAQVEDGEMVHRVERRYLRPDGEVRWGRLSVTHIDHGGVRSKLVVIEDVTQERAAEIQLRHLALHDALTSLPNRALISDRLEHALARSSRDGRMVGVAVVDIDHFKLVNDSYGHQVGDQLLISMAAALGGALRSSDTAGRLGGDEFIVVCEGIRDIGELEVVAERLRAAVRVPVTIGEVTLFPSASVGCTMSGSDSTAERLVAEADMALYRAKARGRGRFEVFDEEMRSNSMAQLELRAELDQALGREEFCLYYQPILDLATSKPIGYEALLRWRHPERGLLLPGAFLDVLTDTELETPVTRWTLQRACEDLLTFGAAGDETSFVSVNLSPRQLIRPGLLEDVQAALEQTGVAPERLWLEITEQNILDLRHRASLQALQDLGCRIALDDFGTGYSGLTYLQQLPVNVLKIDREFVARLATDRVSTGIIAAVTDLAELLELTVVAEGVETKDQSEMLRAMGMQYVQGFLFARPQPAERLQARADVPGSPALSRTGTLNPAR
jgi:diguanylate cyclase (GGDEF)-like protein/PAS domain S-box-containing protein